MFCFSQILNLFNSFVFEHTICTVDKAIHNFQFFFISNKKYSKKVYVIKPIYHKKTGLYQGSAYGCEGDREYDLIHLASSILRNPLLYPISVSNCPRPEHDIFSITNVDLISRIYLERIYILLRASYLHNLTGLGC